MGRSNSLNKVQIYLGEGSKGGVRDIFQTRLLRVPEGEYVSQNSIKNFRLDPDSLIETYNLE